MEKGSEYHPPDSSCNANLKNFIENKSNDPNVIKKRTHRIKYKAPLVLNNAPKKIRKAEQKWRKQKNPRNKTRDNYKKRKYSKNGISCAFQMLLPFRFFFCKKRDHGGYGNNGSHGHKNQIWDFKGCIINIKLHSSAKMMSQKSVSDKRQNLRK